MFRRLSSHYSDQLVVLVENGGFAADLCFFFVGQYIRPNQLVEQTKLWIEPFSKFVFVTMKFIFYVNTYTEKNGLN